MKDELPEDIDAIKEYFGYGNIKAKEAMSILSDNDILQIKQKLSKGGKL